MTTQIRESVFIRASEERVWRFFTTEAEIVALLPKGVRLELTPRMDEVDSRWLMVTAVDGRRREVHLIGRIATRRMRKRIRRRVEAAPH